MAVEDDVVIVSGAAAVGLVAAAAVVVGHELNVAAASSVDRLTCPG